MRRPKAKGNKATQPSQQVRCRRHFPERTLHVVDIENLAGTGIPTLFQVNEVQDWYLTRMEFGAADQAVLASSRRGFINTALGWPHARYKVRSGRDGADLELLDVLEHEDIARRFSHVVIGSGDGIFGQAAKSLSDRGVRVTVVSRPGSLALALAQVAQDVVYLDF
jgi:hypothetical protein